MTVKVEINNVSEGYGERFIVARAVNTELWYYGRYLDYERAEEVAKEIDGIVLEVVPEKK